MVPCLICLGAWPGRAFGSTWGLQLHTVLAVLVPDKVSADILLLAWRVLQLSSEGNAGAIQSWAVAGQTNLRFTCRKKMSQMKILQLKNTYKDKTDFSYLCGAWALWVLGWEEGRDSRPMGLCQDPSLGLVELEMETFQLSHACGGKCQHMLKRGNKAHYKTQWPFKYVKWITEDPRENCSCIILGIQSSFSRSKNMTISRRASLFKN